MVWCSVKNCRNNSIEKSGEDHIKFHQFPKDVKLCKVWNNACDKKDINLKHAKICSIHFDEDSYELKDRLLSIPMKKRKLISTAVPTLFLPNEVDKVGSERNIRSERRRRRKDVEDLLIEAEKQAQNMNVDENPEDRQNNIISGNIFIDNEVQTEGDLDSIHLAEIRELQRQLHDLKQKYLVLEYENKKLKDESLEMDSMFKKIFTSGQLKKLKTVPQSKHYRWSLEDISSAICLYSAGPRSYRYLYKREYPLPCISTLKKWASKVKVEPGIILPDYEAYKL